MKTASFRSIIRTGAAGALALALLGTAQAAEEVVSILVDGQMIKATLETPDGTAAPAPVVLMLHGFTGSRDELPVKDTDEGVFSRTARQLAENGFASLRIDFRGSGESEGAWKIRPLVVKSSMRWQQLIGLKTTAMSTAAAYRCSAGARVVW